jgi:hypothetical protein
MPSVSSLHRPRFATMRPPSQATAGSNTWQAEIGNRVGRYALIMLVGYGLNLAQWQVVPRLMESVPDSEDIYLLRMLLMMSLALGINRLTRRPALPSTQLLRYGVMLQLLAVFDVSAIDPQTFAQVSGGKIWGIGWHCVMIAHVRKDPPLLPPSVPPELRQLIEYCLAKSPEERPVDAWRIVTSLDQAGLGNGWSRAQRESWWQELHPTRFKSAVHTTPIAQEAS